jgi:hypothetical protein
MSWLRQELSGLRREIEALRTDQTTARTDLDYLKLALQAKMDSGWSKVLQGVISRLPWEKVLIVLGLFVMTSGQLSPEMRLAILKVIVPG